jgi:hypothetical protein
MNRPEIQTSELIKLYKSGLGLRQVGARVGITHEAVRLRLLAAGVQLRRRGMGRRKAIGPTMLDRATLADIRRLYVDLDMTILMVAKSVGIGEERVRAELIEMGIAIRLGGHYRRNREVEKLKVGESVEYVRSVRSDPRYHFYKVAKRHGMKVRVNILGGGHFRVTRVA